MTANEIHSLLAGKFPGQVQPLAEPAAGDPYLAVAAAALLDICRFLRADSRLNFDHLRLITGVDWSDKLSAVYHLYSYEHGHALTLRADLGRDEPRLASVCSVWPAADWLERETFDMTGIVFEGHPDLKRILLPLDWEGYPLRKDYKPPKEYHGVVHSSKKSEGGGNQHHD